MMTRTKLALGTAATVIALAACGPSGGTPGNHAGPRIHGVQQAQSQSYVNLDAKDLANLKREHMKALLAKRDAMLRAAERARSR
jgi:hypothetical protein